MKAHNNFLDWYLERLNQQDPKLDGTEPQWDVEDEYTIRTIDPDEFPFSDFRYNLPVNLPDAFFLKFKN